MATEAKPNKDTSASEKSKAGRNAVSEAANWEQRVTTELESSKAWNENWGTLFSGNIPNDYAGRLEYFENQLKM